MKANHCLMCKCYYCQGADIWLAIKLWTQYNFVTWVYIPQPWTLSASAKLQSSMLPIEMNNINNAYRPSTSVSHQFWRTRDSSSAFGSDWNSNIKLSWIFTISVAMLAALLLTDLSTINSYCKHWCCEIEKWSCCATEVLSKEKLFRVFKMYKGIK